MQGETSRRKRKWLVFLPSLRKFHETVFRQLSYLVMIIENISSTVYRICSTWQASFVELVDRKASHSR